jgi:uncharacterized membrane protein
VTLGQLFSRVLWFSLVSIIPSVLHKLAVVDKTNTSVYHHQFVTLPSDSFVKQRKVSLCHYFVHGTKTIWLQARLRVMALRVKSV